MEDKYKPSKEFSDQAWSEMKALLDKEMPDKGAILLAPDQGKRNNLLLLFSLFLLLSLAALFFYYQSNRGLSGNLNTVENGTTELALIQLEKENESTNYRTENVTTASAKMNKSLHDNTVTNSPSSELSLVTNAEINSNSKVPSSKSFNEPLISKTDINIPKTPLIIQNQEENQSTIFEQELLLNKEINAEAHFLLDLENNYEVDKETLKEELKEVNPPVALVVPVDSRVMELLTYEEEVQDVDDFADVKILKNKLPLFAFAGARNYDFSDNIDFAAGLETVIRKRDKKIGLRIGFNYAQRSTTYLTREETIANVATGTYDDEGFESTPTGVSNESFYIARAALNSNPIKYHFLEIPVLLDYQLSKKWSLQGGLSGKTLLYSSSQAFGLLDGVGSRDLDNFEFSEVNSQGDASISYFAPRNINLGASVGVNFMATPRLGLQLRFSQNLLDVYSELPGMQRSNNVEFGVNWRLK